MSGTKGYGQEYDGPSEEARVEYSTHGPGGGGGISGRVNQLAQRVEGGPTRMEQHMNSLHEMNNNLDRACLQYENMLNKLRGHLPEAAVKGQDSVRGDPPMIEAIDMITGEILQKCGRLNNMADELNELI